MAGLGINFFPGLQNSFIDERGVNFLHEIATSCTCRVSDTFASLKGDGKEGRRTPFCPRCGGSGWLYRSPRLVRGIVTNIRQQRNILDAGIAQPGDAMFSPMFGDQTACNSDFASRKIGAFDKLTATWDQPLDDGQVIVRGAGTSGENLGLKTGLTLQEDRIWYEPVNAVWCEDEDGIIYNQGSDFTLGPGKVINWVGNQPPVGRRYTIKYTAYFEWISFQPAQERLDQDQDIGQLVFLRKRHIAFINENPFATDTDKISLQSRIRC